MHTRAISRLVSNLRYPSNWLYDGFETSYSFPYKLLNLSLGHVLLIYKMQNIDVYYMVPVEINEFENEARYAESVGQLATRYYDFESVLRAILEKYPEAAKK